MSIIVEQPAFWNRTTDDDPLLAFEARLGDSFYEIALVSGILKLIISTVCTVVNAAVIAIMFIDPLKILRKTPSNHLVWSLACTDFLVGIVLGPVSGILLINLAMAHSILFSMQVTTTLTGSFILISMLTLLALGVDRLIAVRTPLQYKTKVTKRRVRIAILCVWGYVAVFATVFGILFVMNVVYWIHFVVVFFAVQINYTTLLYSVHKQSRLLMKTTDSEVTLRNALLREKKVAKAIHPIMVIYSICLIPSSTCFFLLFVCKTCSFDVNQMAWAFLLTLSLLPLNSLINPFLYAYRLPKYKQSFEHFFKKCKCPSLRDCCISQDHLAVDGGAINARKRNKVVSSNFYL